MLNRSSGQCPVYLQHKSHPLTSSPPPHHPQTEEQRPQRPCSFWTQLCVYLEQAFLSSLSGFSTFPSAVTLLPWRVQHKASQQARFLLFLCFSFPSSIIDIIDNPSISRPYHNVHLAPKAEVAQLYILITPTPRSNGYALTPGYNEGSGGSVLV